MEDWPGILRRDQIAPLILAEIEPGQQGQVGRDIAGEADIPCQRHLRHGHRRAAIRAIMHRRDETIAHQAADQFAGLALQHQINGWGGTFVAAKDFAQVE